MKRITLLTALIFFVLIPGKIVFAQLTQTTPGPGMQHITADQVDHELRPSITFDFNKGLDNSDFYQGIRGEHRIDYNYRQISMLLELPVSNYSMFRFGIETIEQSFIPTGRYYKTDLYGTGLYYATYNVRLGFRFYLDGK